MRIMLGLIMVYNSLAKECTFSHIHGGTIRKISEKLMLKKVWAQVTLMPKKCPCVSFAINTIYIFWRSLSNLPIRLKVNTNHSTLWKVNPLHTSLWYKRHFFTWSYLSPDLIKSQTKTRSKINAHRIVLGYSSGVNIMIKILEKCFLSTLLNKSFDQISSIWSLITNVIYGSKTGMIIMVKVQ